MEFSHRSVLLNESLELLNLSPGMCVLDCTLGGGGHSEAILERITPGGRLVGIDRDIQAIHAAGKRLERFGDAFSAVHANFQDAKHVLNTLEISGVDAVIMDLGVSSHQLDTVERGFGYRNDVELDMRMDQGQTLSAMDIVNGYEQKDLMRVIRDYGEERWASRIAFFIVEQREKQPIRTTAQLADIIKAAIPAAARREGGHPARRTFQALRIEVNNELGILDGAVRDCADALTRGGRIGAISFHSLEDRIIKQTFRALSDPCTCPPDAPICVCGAQPVLKRITRKPVIPSAEEIAENPRARSAKLRVAEKI